MSKTIIVSNRLPFKLSINKGKISVISSEGGLATGMKSVHSEEKESLWVGWNGLAEEELIKNDYYTIDKKISNYSVG